MDFVAAIEVVYMLVVLAYESIEFCKYYYNGNQKLKCPTTIFAVVCSKDRVWHYESKVYFAVKKNDAAPVARPRRHFLTS